MLGYKFSRILCSLVGSGFPLYRLESDRICSKYRATVVSPRELGQGESHLDLRFAYTTANKGEISEIPPLSFSCQLVVGRLLIADGDGNWRLYYDP
jgi:hypothetical protein